MCVKVCSPTNGGDPFSITRAEAVDAQLSAVGTTIIAGTRATCLYDFLLIAGGTDATTGFTADRYCGGRLNPNPGGNVIAGGTFPDVTVCSKFHKSFLRLVSPNLSFFYLQYRSCDQTLQDDLSNRQYRRPSEWSDNSDC